MTAYYYFYDLVAAVLTAVMMAVYIVQRTYPTRTGRVYVALLSMNLLLAVTDVLTYFIVYGNPGHSDIIKYSVRIICLMSYVAVNICFYYYVLNITKSEQATRVERAFGIVLSVLIFVIVATTPFTHLIEDLSIPGVVNLGGLYPLLYVIGAFLLVFDFYLMFHYRRELNKLQAAAVCGGILLMIAASLLQMSFPEHHVISSGATVIIVLIYAALEDPSEYIFADSDCYNDKSFYISVARSIKNNTGRILVFRIEGYEYISHMLDDRLIRDFRDSQIDFFKAVYGRKELFCLSNDIYAVIVDSDRTDAAEQAIAEFSGNYHIEDFDFALSLITTEFVPSCFRTASDVRHIVDTVIRQHREGDSNKINELTREALEMRDNETRILQCVRNALKNNGFEIYYQPILEEKSNKFVSAEALIRLPNPPDSNNFIPPAVFIPLAEENGLIIQIGEYVFESVCRFYTEHKLDKFGVNYIEVNLSPVQCMQQDLTLKLQSIMRKYGIGPEHINLEITETAESKNKHIMQHNIRTLLNRGMTFSLDDFGTGFSNIDHLASLPVSLIKFDKSLLDDAMADENSKIILESLMQMLKCLKYKCVAEGIETVEMLEMVRSMGCDYYQGYLFSKPVPGKEYLEFLQRN